MTDPADRLSRAQIETIFRHAEAKHYSLPESLHSSMRAEARIREQLSVARGELQQVASVGEVTESLAGDVVEAARLGKPLPDFAGRVAEVEESERQARLRAAVLELALELAGRSVVFGTSPEAIIAGHLRPALAETMARARALLPQLRGYNVEAPEDFLRAPAAVLKAYNEVNAMAERYRALRAARSAASFLAGGPKRDSAGWFAELRDPQAAGVRLGGHANRPQPWPTHPVAYFLWLARLPEGNVWMPLPREQDEVAGAYFEAQDAKRRPTFALG